MSLLTVLKKKNFKSLFTTPSHGGKFYIAHKFYNWYKSDISETDAYNPVEALVKAEKRAAFIYGTKYTKFLTNGSTSGVISAILTCAKNKRILIWDKAHPCHKNGAKLANCEIVEYSLTRDFNYGIYNSVSTEFAAELILKYRPDVLLITSPTYEGKVSDIKAIAQLCKDNNVKLIVDEAHGALYPFSDSLPESAVKYADYTIQSLHKTAGGLNPTALLHSNDINPEEYLNMITTTSPSYPLLATIEANINYLNSSKGRKKIEELISNIKSLNFSCADDVTKILVKKDGMTGYELSKILFDKYNIEDEKTNDVSTMLLCGLGTSKKKLEKLNRVLKDLGI